MVRNYEANPVTYCERCIDFFFEFVERTSDKYPEIFNGSGTSEGKQASDFWFKWGWYATIVELASNDLLKINEVLEMQANEMLLFLAHKLDRAKLEASLRKPNSNVTQL